MNKLLGFSTAVAFSAISFSAQAGGPMAQGTFAIGAERLMGVAHTDLKNDPYPGTPAGANDNGVTSVSLLGNGVPTVVTAGDSRPMFAIPRVGLDYFIIDGLSLGGSFTILTFSNHDAYDANNDGSVTDFLFAPRVGYAYMFGDVVGIWPRGGISYTHGSFDPDRGGGDSSHFFAFDVDVPLIIAPVKNFAFTVGPVFDISLGGSLTNRARNLPEQTRDASFTLFGLTAGVLGLL